MRESVNGVFSGILIGLFFLVGNISFGNMVDEVVGQLLPMADIYESRGCYGKAMKLYENLLQRYPETTLVPVIKFRIARIYQLQGNYDEAFKIYKDLTKLLPRDVSSALIEIGDELMKRGSYKKAIEVYSFWKSEYPTDLCMPTTLLKLSQCREHLYQWKEAVDLLETAITSYPNHPIVPRLFEELRYIWQNSYKRRAYEYQLGDFFRDALLYCLEGAISNFKEVWAFILGYSTHPPLPEVPLPKEKHSGGKK